MVKRVNALEGFLGMSKEMATGTREFRNDIFRKETKNWIVDTVCATFDTGKWETGIDDNGDDEGWIIVEQYEDKEEAKKGQDKWVKLMEKNPKRELKDLNLWDGE